MTRSHKAFGAAAGDKHDHSGNCIKKGEIYIGCIFFGKLSLLEQAL